MREVPVDFVCADMMEAEIYFAFVIHGLPILARSLQKSVSSYYVCFYKFCRAVYGTIYMAFGSQVHDGIWLVLDQYAVYFSAVANVDLLESVALIVAYFHQAFEIAGVGEFVEVDHFIFGVVDDVTDNGGAYEAGAAGN